MSRLLKFGSTAGIQPMDGELPYDRFADVYNRFFAPEAAGATLEALQRLGLLELSSGARILDLCCGSGQLARSLVDLQFEVTGVDNSEAMLVHARRRVPEMEFVLADIRNFAAESRFEAVVCAYNSLAHLHSYADLERTLKNVRRSLLDSGMLLFDLYSEQAFQQRWSGSFSKVDEDFVCVFQPNYDAANRGAENLVTTFNRSQGEWLRSDFILRQHCFTEAEITQAVSAAGFCRTESFDAENDLGLADAGGRVFWRCRGVS